MVRTYKDSTVLDIPFAVLCPVYFLRYPNSSATHVLSVDVLSREIVAIPSRSPQEGSNPSTSAFYARKRTNEQDTIKHVLRTSRLILKRGTLPKWAPAGILRNAESWVLEESEVDLEGEDREMRCWTRNLDHTTVMSVTERNVFKEQPRATSTRLSGLMPSADLKGKARATQAIYATALASTYDVESQIGFVLLRNRIEKFGYNRVMSHIESSRAGLTSTYAAFLRQRNSPLLQTLARQFVGEEDMEKLVSAPSKRQRLLAALRPPFLDGDYVGPIARFRRRAQDVRIWWKSLVRGGSADKNYMWLRRESTESDETGERFLTPMERLRKRFLALRDSSRGAKEVRDD